MAEISYEEYKREARLLYEREKYQKAIQYYEKAQAINDSDCDLFLSMGLCYMNLSEIKNAEEMFQKAQRINPQKGIVYFHLGNIEIMNNNREKGLELYQTAIENGYDDAQIYNSMALLALEEERNDTALDLFTKAIAKDPRRSDIRKHKVALLTKLGRTDAALQALDDMMKQGHQTKYEAYHLKYSLLLKMNKRAEAEAVLEEATHLYAGDYSFEVDAADILANNSQYAEAIEKLEYITSHYALTNTQKQDIAYKKASIYGRNNDTASAVLCLEECEKLAENENKINERALYLLITIQLKKKNYSSAGHLAKKLYNESKENYFIYAGRYMECFAAKQNKEATVEKQYKEAIRYFRSNTLTNSSDFYGYYFRALCLRDLKKYPEAIEIANYLCKVFPNRSEAHAVRADILESMGMKKEAMADHAVIKKLKK